MEKLDDPRVGRGSDGGGTRGTAGAPKEWLVPFLLVRISEGFTYGHELNGWAEEIGFGGMRPGEAYRALWRMEQEGMVVRDRDGSGFRPPLRRYEITEAGEEHLRSWAGSLAQYRDGVDLFFRLHARRFSSSSSSARASRR